MTLQKVKNLKEISRSERKNGISPSSQNQVHLSLALS
jgi:hypothetical protein